MAFHFPSHSRLPKRLEILADPTNPSVHRAGLHRKSFTVTNTTTSTPSAEPCRNIVSHTQTHIPIDATRPSNKHEDDDVHYSYLLLFLFRNPFSFVMPTCGCDLGSKTDERAISFGRRFETSNELHRRARNDKAAHVYSKYRRSLARFLGITQIASCDGNLFAESHRHADRKARGSNARLGSAFLLA